MNSCPTSFSLSCTWLVEKECLLTRGVVRRVECSRIKRVMTHGWECPPARGVIRRVGMLACQISDPLRRNLLESKTGTSWGRPCRPQPFEGAGWYFPRRSLAFWIGNGVQARVTVRHSLLAGDFEWKTNFWNEFVENRHIRWASILENLLLKHFISRPYCVPKCIWTPQTPSESFPSPLNLLSEIIIDI